MYAARDCAVEKVCPYLTRVFLGVIGDPIGINSLSQIAVVGTEP